MNAQVPNYFSSLASILRICAIPLVLLFGFRQAAAQGTAFAYSGRLSNGASAANGIYDVTFLLAGSSNGVPQVGAAITNSGIPIINGTFMVMLDFGSGIFTGNPLWLKIGVRTNGATNFTMLNPLQPVEPTPYAIMASSASNLLGTIPAAQLTGVLSPAQLSGVVVTNNGTNVSLSGAFSGDGSGLSNYQATNLVYSVSTNPPLVSNGTNFSLDFAYSKVIWTLTTNACISNTIHATSGDNHMEVWIQATNKVSPFVISWLPTVNLCGTFTTNGLQLTNSAGYWVMAVSQYGTNWNTNTCAYAIVPPNR